MPFFTENHIRVFESAHERVKVTSHLSFCTVGAIWDCGESLAHSNFLLIFQSSSWLLLILFHFSRWRRKNFPFTPRQTPSCSCEVQLDCFCMSDALHNRIRNDSSEQVCVCFSSFSSITILYVGYEVDRLVSSSAFGCGDRDGEYLWFAHWPELLLGVAGGKPWYSTPTQISRSLAWNQLSFARDEVGKALRERRFWICTWILLWVTTLKPW